MVLLVSDNESCQTCLSASTSGRGHDSLSDYGPYNAPCLRFAYARAPLLTACAEPHTYEYFH